MRILVAGGAGFLGSYVVKDLLKDHDIAIIKRSTTDLWRLNGCTSQINIFNLSETKIQQIFNDFEPEIIINCVCNYGRKGSNDLEVINANLIFGLELLNASIEFNARTYINTGTLLPREINTYSLSKHQLIDWCKFYSSKIQIINFDIEHMLGPLDDESKFIYWLIKQIKTSDGSTSIDLTSGKQQRDFVDVRDVSMAYKLIIKSLNGLSSFESFDLGSGRLIPVKKFIYTLIEILDPENEHSFKDRLNFGAVPYRENDVMEPTLNTSKLKKLGWKPNYKLEETIKEILQR